jgi:hypothetical protein
MMIANCPRCLDKITIPEGASENSNVACPLCRDEFLLSEVLQALPPRLILLDGPEAPEEAEVTTPAAPVADADSTMGILEDVEEETEASEEPVEESASEPEAEDSEQGNAFAFADSGESDSAAPTSIRSSRRPRQKSENPITTMIKVGLGGLMAAPLAQLILWWAFSKDPVKLGPKVSPYVPWVVPKSLRGSGSSQVPTNTDRDDWQRLVRQESTWSPDGWRVAKLDISAASDELPGSTL